MLRAGAAGLSPPFMRRYLVVSLVIGWEVAASRTVAVLGMLTTPRPIAIVGIQEIVEFNLLGE